jgi:hypothetical protein
MSNKAVTQTTDPEYTVEFDGKETYVMRSGVKLAIRRDDGGLCIALVHRCNAHSGSCSRRSVFDRKD